MIPSIKTATILKFIYVLTFASVLVLDASAQGVVNAGKWATVEADNGAVYKIDMVHTWHGNDSLGNVIADAFVWRAEDSLHYFGEFIFDSETIIGTWWSLREMANTSMLPLDP